MKATHIDHFAAKFAQTWAKHGEDLIEATFSEEGVGVIVSFIISEGGVAEAREALLEYKQSPYMESIVKKIIADEENEAAYYDMDSLITLMRFAYFSLLSTSFDLFVGHPNHIRKSVQSIVHHVADSIEKTIVSTNG